VLKKKMLCAQALTFGKVLPASVKNKICKA